MNTRKVEINSKAIKDIKRLPKHIVINLRTWIATVSKIGLLQTRKLKGYHDEPLHGDRKGQRSVRLNKAYRAIYKQHDNGNIELNYIEVIEVNKHKY
ncbi:type II toxin-antitoxin system mRNA interferase toxin, RelE/StbE family [Francisella sp. LA112445]|uniref:type II toxin-antitoxin system mRNA interferase toxin, RelE/StbE family n=1 Tax=Francisella sp. LA112445 TaxID=1395624 RepID=UPI001788B0EF|nr:type II toxin-antitoxin system mRNA interferase toxin, RelE/StbE family [Francisella sp. LA112445]QIW09168.1 type II toxin-antitoxin system mRNA interferase toxin, RelE/StbE family [Francisella sp. LA112445]